MHIHEWGAAQNLRTFANNVSKWKDFKRSLARIFLELFLKLFRVKVGVLVELQVVRRRRHNRRVSSACKLQQFAVRLVRKEEDRSTVEMPSKVSQVPAVEMWPRIIVDVWYKCTG